MEASKVKHAVFQPAKKSEDERNPIIFLHAMLCTKEIWTDIPQRVADATGRTVYTYDARCHGANKDMKSFSFEALVEDLFALMSELKIEKAILVGHSMGGKTAINVALKNPEKVEKVFIVDMCVTKIENNLIERSIRFLDYWKKAVQKLPVDTPVENVTSLSVPDLYAQLPEAEQMNTEKEAYLKSNFVYVKKDDGKYDVSYNAEELQSGLEKYKAEAQELSGKYEGPAYFLYGTESPYKVGEKDEVERIKNFFTKFEMIPFEGAPHHIFVHCPDKFVSVLVEKILLA